MNQEQLLINKKAEIFSDEFNAFMLDSSLIYKKYMVDYYFKDVTGDVKRCITYWIDFGVYDYYVNVDYEYNKNQFRFLINDMNNYKKHHRYAIYNTDDIINIIKKDFNL